MLAQIIRTHPSYWLYKGLDSLDANQGHFARRLSPTPGLLSLVSAGAEMVLTAKLAGRSCGSRGADGQEITQMRPARGEPHNHTAGAGDHLGGDFD
jgi:hypothetical protein